MDAFLLKRIVAELSERFRGTLVSKVHQPRDREIVLTLWTGREEARLLLSAHPDLCRLHLTTRRIPNPVSPPRFCQYLRRHLVGMRLAAVSVAPFDRLVRMEFFSPRPDAVHERTTLFAELYGRHANLIYVGPDGLVLEPLRTVSQEESRIREVASGVPYRPLPKPERIFLPEFTAADAERIHAMGWEGLPRVLQREVSGLGQELAHEAAGRGRESPDTLFAAIRELVRRYEEDDFSPGIGTLPTGKKRILPFPCPSAGFADFAPASSANEAADRFYGEIARNLEDAVLRQQLRSRLSALLRKERHKLENVGGDEERLKEGLKGGERGETLKANLAALRKGMAEFRGISLDPAKTPVENMTRYFLQHKKAKRATEIVRRRKREVAETVYYLESLEAQLAAAAMRDDLLAVRQELSATFAPRKPGKRKTAKAVGKAVVPEVEERPFRGYTLLLGKNNQGNDRIVKELARPDDLWLHTQGIPGSHVLIRRPPGAEIPDEVVEEAARLAVFHSKAKGSPNVPVFLAEARHVSKFKGAKPGLVRIAKYRTINVR
ncbi:MAG TPA: NFACT RNA binding domain-containing protein [Candidatus Deferrimicrobiaceae bacterium]|nr:NFACT RNA binding domain-containing protein [Candidatus Deferrimicrobiaceae bacterium]